MKLDEQRYQRAVAAVNALPLNSTTGNKAWAAITAYLEVPDQSDGIYTEGVSGDGVVILCDGQPLSISQVLARLNRYDRLLDAINWIETFDPQIVEDARDRFGEGEKN